MPSSKSAAEAGHATRTGSAARTLPCTASRSSTASLVATTKVPCAASMASAWAPRSASTGTGVAVPAARVSSDSDETALSAAKR